ncbi:MAG TPA: hypothetical protein VD793_09820, partial [Gemmatimonadales bacterium]|nr:hypothetical protein [Gemmatimonadales bacterium]
DLTLNDKSRQQMSGGLTPDNLGVEYAGVVFAIAESRLKPGLIWAGTNDGLVQLTRDGGATWTNLTANLPGLPAWGTISQIEPSRFDTATAYLTVDLHQVNNREPFAYKTTDYGRTWRKITNGVPVSPLSYAHFIKEDPVRRGLLYLGTENAVYLSFNDGELWQPLQNNLPHAPVYGIAVQEHFSDLVVGTYGRGFWILDDITPLRELTPEVTARDAHFFRPRNAYRFRFVEPPMAPFQDPVAGQNPRYGASLHFWLKAASPDSASLTIADPTGRTVRTFKAPAQAGVNRVYWDLQYDQTREARIRRSPPYSDYPVPAEGMAAPGVGRFAVLAPPGNYTVKINVAGQELTQPLTVLKDPNSGGSEAELATQIQLASDIAADLNTTVDMINASENIRAQLATLKSVLAADSAAADVRAAVDSLERKVIAVEEPLFQTKVTGRGQDIVRWPMQLAEQLWYLAGSVTSSDFGPTTSQREVHQELKAVLRNAQAGFNRMVNDDLRAFNDLLSRRGMQGVIAGTRPPGVP